MFQSLSQDDARRLAAFCFTVAFDACQKTSATAGSAPQRRRISTARVAFEHNVNDPAPFHVMIARR